MDTTLMTCVNFKTELEKCSVAYKEFDVTDSVDTYTNSDLILLQNFCQWLLLNWKKREETYYKTNI